MLAEIREAQTSIYLEMYIFVNDTSSHDFLGTLISKAREGVRVKIIIDSYGSSELGDEVVQEMREAGIEVLFFSYMFYHTHRKILVVDERVAFLGGVNIYKFFRKWNDLQVRLEGPIVKYIIRSFARAYYLCGGYDSSMTIYYDKKADTDHHKLFFVEHFPGRGVISLAKIYKKKIDSAKKSIIILTPYFAPRRWLIARLHQAVLRGVDVRVIVPRTTDHWVFTRTNYFFISFVHALGVKFYMSRAMNHAKVMLIDGHEGVVGSQNIDLLSFDYNTESGVFFTDPAMIADLSRIIAGWQDSAASFDPLKYKKRWFDYLLAPLGRIAQRIFFGGVLSGFKRSA